MLRTERLTKSFGGNVAVDNVSIAISMGEILGLVGPNGSGKSTLVSLLLGMNAADSGRVELDGEDIGSRPPSKRREIAVSFQVPQIVPNLTAVECASITRIAHGSGISHSTQLARDRLQSLGLGRLMHDDSGSLSGGQRKIVDFARAMVSGAEFIILDEPTAGVNEAVQREMTLQIRQATADQAVGIIVVSHHLDWLFAFANRVGVMQGGRVIAVGPPDEVRKTPEVLDAFVE